MKRLAILLILFCYTNIFACNVNPVAVLTISKSRSVFGEIITLDGSASADPDGGNYGSNNIKTYQWDFDYNGTFLVDYAESYPEDGIATHGFKPTFVMGRTRNRFAKKTITVALRVIDNDYIESYLLYPNHMDIDIATLEVSAGTRLRYRY